MARPEQQVVPIEKVWPNPDNPRFIKDENFNKLVESIRKFPQMLHLRPLVVNNKLMVLGGNMRLEACKAIGMTEVPIVKAGDLTPEQQREFVIKDNVSGGEWDWDVLNSEWSKDDLLDWGMNDILGNDWEDLDYIEGDQVNKSFENDLKITVVIPEDYKQQKKEIQYAMHEWLNEKYPGCDIK